MIHNIELKPGKGGQLARSAGNGAQLMAKEDKYAQVRLPSGEVRKVLIQCRATSEKLATSIIPTSRSVKQVERDTWAGDLL